MQQTPLMAQYYSVKEAYPDTIILFRVGDFYETFEEDARISSRVLGITLTRRGNGAAEDTPLAGFPHHAVDTYLPKLVRAGYRVAICEQLENPKLAKGLVKRDVIEIVTPGVAFSDKLLDHKKNNYLLSIIVHSELAGIAFCDVSTGEFFTYEIPESQIRQQIEHISPAEILISKKNKETLEYLIHKTNPTIRISKIDEWIYQKDYAEDLLTRHFASVNLKGFGIERLTLGVLSAGAILHYLQETQKSNLSHLNKIAVYNPSDYMLLDYATKRNLEIIFSMQDGSREGSLIAILDKTETPMGGRLLKKWVSSPLIKLQPIQLRQEAIEILFKNQNLRDKLLETLREIGDLERLISKTCTGRANPRDIVSLKTSLKKIPSLKEAIKDVGGSILVQIREKLAPLTELTEKIDRAIVENPPVQIVDGGVIQGGFSAELDELRNIAYHGKDWIAKLQKTERERTGISSLKVSYNRVFGYYIEISHANKDKIPDDYIRKQTLVNSERFITPDLKTYEEKILHAEEKIFELESELFNELRLDIANEAEPIQQNAQLIAMLDCLLSLAICAVQYNYVKPELDENNSFEILEGRHPVVERILPPTVKFTPNNCILDSEKDQIIILTGPNMAGKSVYLRQIGLVVLLAQIGSFVPAKSAKLSIVDRIFTRVGASDNISAGESTFLVEMQEAANIMNNATSKSLILLDEIGRGTSTFDGISIAWAITEYLHENPDAAAKTIFATHYHELNEMADIFPRIRNYKVEVREINDKVIFLHKVNPGRADHSYGIQVAQMAGLPKAVTDRAKEILNNLESKELTPYEVKKKKIAEMRGETGLQLSLFEIKDDKIRKAINDIEIESMTPLDALNKLQELKKNMNSEE
jgi:DNA mismatch repair protein MutS